MIHVYAYAQCSTCRKALAFLAKQKQKFTVVPIREQPPSKAELERLLDSHDGNIRRLFNTSGQDYQKLGLKDRLPKMSTDEALKLLAANGNLVKRPVLITPRGCTSGFNEERWQQILGN